MNKINTEDIELSVVMPCLNEAKTVATCINKALKAMKDHSIIGEVILADNGSTDGSQQIAKDLGCRVIDIKEKGYGNALKGGIKAARGTYIIMGDADDSYDFSLVHLFVSKLREGFDLVVGNRFAGGISKSAMPFMHQYFGNPVISFLGRTFFKAKIGDFYCGLRGFRKDAVDKWKLRSNGMEFAIEMIVKSTMLNMKVTEIPTTLVPDGRDRKPHLRTWRDGWRTLRFLLLYSPRWLFFYPGIFLILIGFVGAGVIIPGTFQIGNIKLDIHSLVYASALISIGFTAVSFSVLSRIYAFKSDLIPNEPKHLHFLRCAPLEIGIFIGLIVILLGIAGFITSVFMWKIEGFGDMNNPVTTMRIVVPSALAFIVGTQIIFTSFFLSILGIKREQIWEKDDVF